MCTNHIADKNFTKAGLGTSRIASLSGRLRQNEINILISTALENNVRVIDTADTYGSGDAERAVARAIAGKRNEFFIMTKAGFPHMHLPGSLSPLNQIGKKIIQKIAPNKNFSKNYLLKSCTKSLSRLQIDHVDAFLLHEPQYNEIISGECWEALAMIKKSGKAKYTGVSTSDVKVLEAGLSSNTIDLVQTPVSFTPGASFDVIDFCRQHKIPFVANQILATAALFTTRNDFKGILKKYNTEENAVVPLLIGYVAYIQKADCLLTGTKNANHLKSNVLALQHQTENLNELFKELDELKQ